MKITPGLLLGVGAVAAVGIYFFTRKPQIVREKTIIREKKPGGIAGVVAGVESAVKGVGDLLKVNT